MADDISIFVKVVGQKEIVSTTNSLNKLETGVKRLSKDLSKGRIDSAQYTTGLKELRRGVDSSFSSWQKAKTAVDQYSKELKEATAEQARAQAAIKAETAALKQYRQARREATAENARYDAEQRKAAKTARDTATANRRLRMEFKEGYAAQVQLRAAQMRLNQAMRKGVIDTDQYETQLQQLKIAQQSMGTAAQVGGRRVNSSGMLIQQAGYQFGDFAVQVQGGTNPMVAFGQQATQMIGAFNMLPQATLAASVGIGALRISVVALIASLGVIIPVLTAVGAYFMRANAAAKETSESIETFADRLKSARGEIRNMKQALEVLRGGFENVFEMTLTEEIVQARISVREAQQEINAEMRRGLEIALAQNEAFGTLTDTQVRAQAEAALASSGVILAAKERLRLAEEELAVFEATAVEIRKREREESVVNQLHEARMILQEQEAEKRKESEERLTRIRMLMGEITAETRESEKALAEAAEAARRLYDTDLAKGVRAAAEAAQQLAKDLGISLRSAMAMAGMIVTRPTGDVFDPRDPSNQSSEAALERARRIMESGELANSTVPTETGTKAGTTGRGTAQQAPTDPTAEAVAKLQTQLNLQRELIGMTEEEAHVRQALGETYSNVSQETITSLQQQYAETQKLKTIANTVANSFANAFTSMVDGTMSVKDAFKNMAREIIKQLWKIFVVEQVVNSIKMAMGVPSFGGSGMTAAPSVNPMAGMTGAQMLPQAMGGAWSQGVQMFANGGVVNSPTMFGHSGGLGVMGEAGPEAIMPLKRGSNGKLGVQMEGGGGGDTINVVQNFNMSANGDESVKRIIAQAAPKIAQMTKSSLLDDRRRGGATKAAFG